MDYSERRREQARRTEQAILQATSELSRQRSFDKVSVRDICARAGITTGAFYHHFRSKEELLDRGFASLDSFLEKTLAQPAPTAPEQLWAILSAYTAFLEEQGWELIARYYERRLSDPRAVHSMDPDRYTVRAVTACLEQAQREGLLDPGENSVKWLSDFFFRHFRGVVIDWLLHCGAYPLLDKVKQDHSLFEHIFRA